MIYEIKFKADLTEDDVRAMQKYFFDTMNESMEIFDLWDLELKEVKDDNEPSIEKMQEYSPHIDDIVDDANWYGFLFTHFDNNIKGTIHSGLQANNYINIQTDDVVILCDKCDVVSLNKLKQIFNSGVRIWYSLSKADMLDGIWYSNTEDTED